MEKILAGLAFAALWGSGSVAIKTGVKAVQPLVLNNARFLVAGLLMLIFSLLVKKHRLPQRHEWLPLFLCGMLSIAIYPIAFAFAMREVTAGIGTLANASCPLVISILSSLWLHNKINVNVWIGLLLGVIGVTIATFPLLQNASATPFGMFLMGVSVLCYSVGTVYYQSVDWKLPRLSINAWQVFFGFLLMLPITTFFYEPSKNDYNTSYWFSMLWLAIPISIGAIQAWLFLLKADPTKASLWLFLCPIFGFLLAAVFLNEPVTIFTVIGTVLVILGLYVGKKES